MPHIIGLTGGIASGKTSVASLWLSAGVCVIDADAIAREVVEPGRPALWLIRRHFGPRVIRDDGTLDRAVLGRVIFSDPCSRAALNRRMHPFIIATMLSRVFSAVFLRWRTVVVLDTPLLFESKTLLPFCSKVVVVSCDPEQQVARMVARDGVAKGVSEEDARKRLASQMPLAEKVRRADVVIDNSGAEEGLKARAMQVLDELQPSPAGEVVFRTLVCAFATKLVFRTISTVHRRFMP